MPTRCLLIPTAAGIDPIRRYEAATRIGRTLHAHLNVLFVSLDPARFVTTLPEVAIASGVNVESITSEIDGYARASHAALKQWCAGHTIPLSEPQERLDATFATWKHVVGELETEVALAGRVNDIVIIDQPDIAEPFTERVFDAAVFSTGRPALVVPKEVSYNLLGHVMIAWNGSLEAARAIGQSMSLLHEAERVTIIEVETSRSNEARSADLEAYLRNHGIVASSRRVERIEGSSVAQRIASVAGHLDATMLVMGAYTHSRLREFFLGGVTKHMLDRAKIPILMAH